VIVVFCSSYAEDSVYVTRAGMQSGCKMFTTGCEVSKSSSCCNELLIRPSLKKFRSCVQIHFNDKINTNSSLTVSLLLLGIR
jgi:hypothetical protein